MKRRYFARPGRRSVARRIFFGLLGAVVVLAAIAAGAMAWRGPEIARRIVATAAAQAGIAPLRSDVRSIGIAGMTLGDVRIEAADGPAASAIEIGWTPGGLLRGRVGHVRVHGLTAKITIENGNVIVHGLPRGESTGGMVVLPVERLELDDAKLVVMVGTTQIDIAADASLVPADDGLTGAATIEAEVQPGAGEPVRVLANLPQWRVGDGGSGLHIAIAGAEVTVPDQNVMLSAIEAQAATGSEMSARLSGTLRDLAQPARIVPLALTAEARGEPDKFAFSGRGTGMQGALVATFEGTHQTSAGAGSLDFAVAPVRFAAAGLQPSALSPAIGNPVRRVEGAVSARGALTWGKGFASSGTVTLDRLAFSTGPAEVRELSGTIRLLSLLPSRTAPAQRIAAQIVVAGLPAMPLDLRFAIPSADRLVIESATLGFAGGALALADITMRNGKPVDADLLIRDVDLGALLALLNVEGLTGSGRIEGSVPFRIDQDGVVLDSGRLSGTVPGVLRYTGSALPEPAADAPATDPVRLMRTALADFHYEELRFTLERAASGEGSLLVNLKGANPQVLDNHPFVFNIRLDADFGRLAAILFEGYAAADALMRARPRP
jgi:hypothetical protein